MAYTAREPEHRDLLRMLRESYRSLLRPFGLDVQKDEDGDKMPPAAACLGNCMVSRLSSRRDQWMKIRAVLTQSSLVLGNSSDQTLAVHRILLMRSPRSEEWEKTRATVASTSIGDRAGNKHRKPGRDRDVVKKNLKPDNEDSEPDEAKPDLLERTRILQLNTEVDGFNFGRTYKLRFKYDITMEEWQAKLLALRELATRSIVDVPTLNAISGKSENCLTAKLCNTRVRS